jgi:hypothetical protein
MRLQYSVEGAARPHVQTPREEGLGPSRPDSPAAKVIHANKGMPFPPSCRLRCQRKAQDDHLECASYNLQSRGGRAQDSQPIRSSFCPPFRHTVCHCIPRCSPIQHVHWLAGQLHSQPIEGRPTNGWPERRSAAVLWFALTMPAWQSKTTRRILLGRDDPCLES